MTKTLATLIKVSQHEVDDQRRVLAELETIRARLEQELDDLKAAVEHEKEVSRRDAEAASRWPAYLDWAMKREKEINGQITEMQNQIDAARDELQRRFETLKKYELAKQAADMAEAREAARQEQIELDEIASNQERRK